MNPYLTNLSKSDIITIDDIRYILNLPQNDIDRLASQLECRKTEVIPKLMDKIRPTNGFTVSDNILFQNYVQVKDANAAYDLIVRKATDLDRIRPMLTEGFKYTDDLGHFREKFLPTPELQKPNLFVPMETHRNFLPVEKEVDPDTGRPKQLFSYLVNTRGISPALFNYLYSNNFIYQGLYNKKYNEKKGIFETLTGPMCKRVLAVNGFNGDQIAYQSVRELWDVWDNYRTSEKFLEKAKEKPYILYKTVWNKDTKTRELVYKTQKINGIDQFILDKDGRRIPELLTPMKKDIYGSIKEFAWRFNNPNSKQVYIFEAPLDAFSFMDLIVQSNSAYNKDGTIRDSIFANFLTLGGLANDSLVRFLRERPDIKQIYLCFDNDASGLKKAVEYKQWLQEQYNFPDAAVKTLTCPRGYQKVDCKGYGLRDSEGKPVEVKDYNEYLRAWSAAGKIKEQMAKIGADYQKENSPSKEKVIQTVPVQPEVKKAYIEQSVKATAPKKFDYIPEPPQRPTGELSAAYYRENRSSVRSQVFANITQPATDPKEKYLKQAGRNEGEPR